MSMYQCLVDVSPPYTTLDQRKTDIDSASCVCCDVSIKKESGAHPTKNYKNKIILTFFLFSFEKLRFILTFLS